MSCYIRGCIECKSQIIRWASRLLSNWRIDSPFVGPSKMTKCRKLRNDITHIIWAFHVTEYCVCRWLRAHAMFDVTCFPAFVGASGGISTIRLIRYYMATDDENSDFVHKNSIHRIVDFKGYIVSVKYNTLCKERGYNEWTQNMSRL